MPANQRLLSKNLVDKPYSTLCSAAHKAVALGVALNHFHDCPVCSANQRFKPLSQKQNFFALNLNIGRLTLCAAAGLMNHRPALGKMKRFPFVPPLSKNAPIEAA